MRASPTFSETIDCKLCGVTTVRRGPIQSYCIPCSEARDLERKRKWAAKNPPKTKTRENQKAKSIAERVRLQDRGRIASSKLDRGMGWPVSCDDDIYRFVRVKVPFSWGFSKNAIFSMNRKLGHVFIRKKSRDLRNNLTALIAKSVKDERFFTGKVWLDIFVQKPDNKGDAVNVVDMVCDAVKDAIGVDDRYFSIRKLDWQIMKENPMLYVGVGQSITEDHFYCCYCGREQPLTNRSSQKSTCKDCRFNTHNALKLEIQENE